MLHVLLNNDPWFEPKIHGYGAGWPCAWQGWALLAGYFAVLAGAMMASGGNVDWPLLWALPATAILLIIARRHTRGGWRWRHGDDGQRGNRKRNR